MIALLCALAAAPLPAAPTAPAGPAQDATVLVMDLRNDGVSAETARILGDSITARLATRAGLRVVSAEDVRRAVDFEGQKRELGCATNECLAEIAQAMGADHVVFGNVGALGAVTVVSLTWHDARRGAALARQNIEVDNVDKLAQRVRAAVDALADDAFGIARDEPLSSLVVVGGVAGGVGALLALAGAGVALWATTIVNDNTPVVAGKNDGQTKLAAQSTGQAGVAVLCLGVVVGAAGGFLAAWGTLE